jgi:hypothetical protein
MPTDMDVRDQPNEVDTRFHDPAAAFYVDEDTTHDGLDEFQGSGVEKHWDGRGEDEMNEGMDLEFGGVADDDEGNGSHVNDGIFMEKMGE